jgi:MFS family permease
MPAAVALAILTIRKSFRQAWLRFGTFAAANLIGVALALPMVVLVGIAGYLVHAFHLLPFAIVILLGILPNPFTAGVQFMGHQLAQDDVLSLEDQWEGLRQYSAFAVRLWLPSIALTALIIFEVTFYITASSTGKGSFHIVSLLLGIFWAYVLVFWLSIHLYVFPLLMEQDERKVWTTYRNAVIISVSRPVFTSIVALLWIAVLFIGSVTGLALVIALALGALLQQNALAHLIPTFERSSS